MDTTYWKWSRFLWLLRYGCCFFSGL